MAAPDPLEGNTEAVHFRALYREAHMNSENLRRRYVRMMEGAEAILSTLDRESPTYVLLDAVLAASRWDGENAPKHSPTSDKP